MFQSTRLKLTLWYLMIIMFVSIVFSSVIYNIISRQIEDLIHRQNEQIQRSQEIVRQDLSNMRIEPPPQPPIIDPQLLKDQEKKLAMNLFLVNIGIIFIAGGAGYILSGKTLHPIKQMLDDQNQFITDASHELRTPIAVLRAEMEEHLLEKHISDTESRTLIRSNLEEIDTLQTLTNNLLKLSSPKFNTAHQHERIPISLLIETAVKRIEALAKEKHIAIQTFVISDTIVGDATQICEVCIIILENAIKYSPPKTTITIHSQKNERFSSILFSDEGFGVADKDLPHIFDRFYRADRSRSQIPGYGLGLSIAKKIIEEHHGSIIVQKNKRKGITVIVQFPHSTIKTK